MKMKVPCLLHGLAVAVHVTYGVHDVEVMCSLAIT